MILSMSRTGASTEGGQESGKLIKGKGEGSNEGECIPLWKDKGKQKALCEYLISKSRRKGSCMWDNAVAGSPASPGTGIRGQEKGNAWRQREMLAYTEVLTELVAHYAFPSVVDWAKNAAACR